MMFLVWMSIAFIVPIQVSLQHIYSVGVNEGDAVSIQCNTTERTDKEIYWTRNNTAADFHIDGLFLNFTSISRTDHGEYICNSFDNKTQVLTEIGAVMVNVSYEAKVKSIRIDPQQLKENGTYTVYCDVDGNPPPQLRVRNNSTKEVLASASGSGPFTTKSVKGKCGDTGTIVCEANNTLNKDPAYMTENITVYCSPRPIENNNYIIHALVGGQAFLKMHFQGYPYPNYTWSHDDGQPVTHASQIDYPTLTVLNFSSLAIADLGNYTVRLENTYGYYIAAFQLNAWGFPQMPFNLSYSDVTWNSVRLYWTSGFDMGAPQHFIIKRLGDGNSYTPISDNIYDNSSTHGVGQNWTYLQTGLESNTNITLTVQSVNEFGLPSHYLPGVSFHTLPLPSGSRGTTYSVIGVTVVLVTQLQWWLS